jgi:predicted CXXCH cytochrome family protein
VLIATAAPKSIELSKHNLSSSSTNTIRSATTNGTTEICVFCHTPHTATPDAPLWNRTNVSGPYTTYASDVMTALSYSLEDPSSTSAAGKAEHVKTRICMSCHDGTIAMGNVVNLPSGFPVSEISMVGAAGGLMPSTEAGYIGTDLRDDHPVAVKHLPSQDQELKAISGSNARVYSLSGGKVVSSQVDGGYVECTSCHDPHDDQYGNFLIDENVSSKMCRSCHSKVGIDQSAGSGTDESVHTNINAGSNAYAPPTGGTPGTLGATVQEVKCMACHFPHKSGVESATPASPSPGTGKYLLAYNGEQTCFNATNRWGQSSASVCHTTASKNIQSLVQLTNAHRVGNYTAPGTPHNATEGRTRSGTGWLGVAGNSWHVECDDCHNSHTTGRRLHTVGTNTVTSTSAIYGTGGAEPGGTGAWTVLADSAYTYIEPGGAVGIASGVTKEYQICLKCHSSFAWGTSGPASVPTSNLTDQAKEFNPLNASYHPVMNAAANTWGTYLAPWTAGSQLMYCSDCHGNSSISPAPQGPHGSANAKILVLPYSGSTYGAAGGGAAGAQPAGELCFKCHDPNVYNNPTLNTTTATGFAVSGSGFNLHNQHRYREDGNTTTPNPIAYRCVNCHVRVAHGWQRKGLVVISGDGVGEPWPGAYEAGGQNTAPISTGSSLPASGSYGAAKGANCVTMSGCHQ